MIGLASVLCFEAYELTIPDIYRAFLKAKSMFYLLEIPKERIQSLEVKIALEVFQPLVKLIFFHWLSNLPALLVFTFYICKAEEIGISSQVISVISEHADTIICISEYLI